MPTVQQPAVHKSRLLLKLLFSRPSELYDRIKTKAEGMLSPPQHASASAGLDLAAMLAKDTEGVTAVTNKIVIAE